MLDFNNENNYDPSHNYFKNHNPSFKNNSRSRNFDSRREIVNERNHDSSRYEPKTNIRSTRNNVDSQDFMYRSEIPPDFGPEFNRYNKNKATYSRVEQNKQNFFHGNNDSRSYYDRQNNDFRPSYNNRNTVRDRSNHFDFPDERNESCFDYSHNDYENVNFRHSYDQRNNIRDQSNHYYSSEKNNKPQFDSNNYEHPNFDHRRVRFDDSSYRHYEHKNPATIALETMRRWNLKFNGSKSEDPEAFLMKIIEGRSIIHVSDQVLLQVLPFFLSGVALNWFRGSRHLWRNFEEFYYSFQSRFVDPDFQFELRQEVYRRTQGERESVSDFITCMLSLFDRIVPRLSVDEELSFVHRNLLPRFQMIIPRQNLVSISQLEKIAKSVEKSHSLSRVFRPPPTPEKSLLPDLAYREPSRSRNQHNKESLNLIKENNLDIDSLLDSLWLLKNLTIPIKITKFRLLKLILTLPQ